MIKMAWPLVNHIVSYAVVNAVISVQKVPLQFINVKRQTSCWMIPYLAVDQNEVGAA